MGSRFLAWMPLVGLGLTGCNAGEPVAPSPPTTGAYVHFVQSGLHLPRNPAESKEFAQNIDGDPRNSPDNRLGNVAATFFEVGGVFDLGITASISTGSALQLYSLRADSLVDDPSVSWQVYEAMPPAGAPDFSGNGTFEVSATSPADDVVLGGIQNGEFVGGPGRLELLIAFAPGVPIAHLPLIGARIDSVVTLSGGMGARLGGGILTGDAEMIIIPGMAQAMNAAIAADPGCRVKARGCGPSTQRLLDLFDKNRDGIISLQELKSNDLIKAEVSADVDLLDSTNGNRLDPRKDGMADSLSIGVEVDLVPATFTAPNEH